VIPTDPDVQLRCFDCRAVMELGGMCPGCGGTSWRAWYRLGEGESLDDLRPYGLLVNLGTVEEVLPPERVAFWAQIIDAYQRGRS
jgi:hypothetical protein